MKQENLTVICFSLCSFTELRLCSFLQVVVVYNEDDAADQDNAYPELADLIRRSDPASDNDLSEDDDEEASSSESDDGYASSDHEGPSHRPGK